MKLCLTAVGAAVTAREKRKQIPTTQRPKETIALVPGTENSVGDLTIEGTYCSREGTTAIRRNPKSCRRLAHDVSFSGSCAGQQIKVRLPQVLLAGEGAHEAWARIATLMAGTNRETWFIPDVGDEVVVAFEQGNLDRPYVLGSLME